MSRRTAAADKAIRLAWEQERKLVAQGKGTRDWTEEQQKDILDPTKGKAYDDNGRAFEGQHMKSAEKYPEYQGDPDNIQFLTREEHLEAHRGNWQNPTNWYYDPVTKERTDFGKGEYIRCKEIELSNPIEKLINKTNSEVNDLRLNNSQRQENVHNKVSDKSQADSSSKAQGANAVKTPKVKIKLPKGKNGVNKIINFCQKNPKIIKDVAPFVVFAVTLAAKIGIKYLENSESSNGSSSGLNSNGNNNRTNSSEIEFDNDEGHLDSENNTDDIGLGLNGEDPGTKGTPKRPHTRSGHPHHYRTKDGLIEKWLDDIQVHKDQMDDDSKS